MTTHACTDVLWLTATDGFHEAHCRVCDRVVPAAELLSPAELWLVRKISDRTQSILKVFPPGHAALKVLHNAVVHMLLAVFVDEIGRAHV